MKRILINLTILCFLLLTVDNQAQTVIFSENFDGALNWTLNTPGASLISGSTPVPGGSPNTWAVNNNDAGDPDRTIDFTNNLHITCSGFICNILGAPGPVYNASGPANRTNTAAVMSTDIAAAAFVGAGPFTLSFQWKCKGASNPTNGSARLIYSVDGGTTWTENTFNYNYSAGYPAISTATIDMDTLTGFTPGVNNIRLGFRWFNDGTTGHVDPPMIVDNIQITIPSVSNTITTGIISGSPFCPGSTFNVPFTSTGTFNTGNIYTAQLSDASGSFASPTAIGTLNSTANTGSIPVTIPGLTPPGTGYTIRVVSSNPVATGTVTLPFTILAPVTPTFNAIANLCQNATAPALPSSSTNATPINGTWSPAVINTATVGTSTYTFTPNAGQCAATTTMDITIVAPVTPTFNPIGPVCQGTAAPNLPGSSTNSTPITGTWSPATVSTATVGITTYTFTPNAGQCATTATLSIEITAPNITPTFNPIGPLCINATAPSLPGSSTNATPVTGTWSPAVINTASAGITTYTFTPNAGQCALTTTLDIEITGSITPTFAAIGPVCQGTAAPNLPGSSTNSTPITGTWSPATVSTATVGITTYTFTPNAGQCAATATLSIEITAPNITPTFNPIGPLCINATAPSLPGSSTNATPVTGTWSPAVINTASAGITTYTFTPNAGQCALTATLDIEITTSITPTFDPIGPLCLNSTAPALPTNSTNLPAIAGTWSPATINTSALGTTVYNFTANPGQCASNTSISVEITNSMTPTFAAIGPVCQGTTAPLLPSSSSNNPAITGTWSPAVIDANTLGTATYLFTPDPGQCSTTLTMDIEVIPAPPAPSISIAANTTTICAGDMVNFTATPNSSNPGDVIQWYINNTIVTGATGLLFSSNTLNNNDQITAVFTPSSSCLSGQTATSNLIVITVNPSVTPTISINATSTQICEGQSVTFNSNITGGGTSPQIQWFVNGNAVSGANNASFTSSSLSNSDVVTAQLISSSGCASPNTANSNSLAIIVIPMGTPTITIEANRTVICVGQTVILNATLTYGGPAPQFQWHVGGNTFTTTTATFTVSGLTSSADVSCTLVSNYLCVTSATAQSNTISIQLNQIPSVTLSPSVTIHEGESTVLTATAPAAMTYMWVPSESLSCSDCLTPTATPEQTTVYNFSATDPLTGCAGVDSVSVTVIRTFDIWVPSAFSPNDDHVNDVLYVRGNNVKNFTFRVFDRWGNKLFETSDLKTGWDGEYQGRKVNAGILVYTLTYELKDGTSQTIKGNITVSN